MLRSFAVQVPAGNAALDSDLHVPENIQGIVVFAHGSGSSRFSTRNRYVARVLHAAGFATLLLDLLTPEEERIDAVTARLRFDIPLLAVRLGAATEWVAHYPQMKRLPIGYFGASTGAAAALISATRFPESVQAVVSRGGRPDLAMSALPDVLAPTLLIVGGDDEPVIAMNRDAYAALVHCEKDLIIIPGATHLFEEPGTLESVAQQAAVWFTKYLRPQSSAVPKRAA